MTNAELSAAAISARTQVGVEFGIMDADGNYHPIDLSSRSDGEALLIRDYLVSQRKAGNLRSGPEPNAPPVDLPSEIGTTRGSTPKINEGKQGKHIPSHNNYQPGRSRLTADPQQLATKAGTGHQVGNIPRGQPGFKERVDFGRVIGEYVDKSGKAVQTTKGIIHYAKDGSIHIVPARP
jgi:hypothetical protein